MSKRFLLGSLLAAAVLVPVVASATTFVSAKVNGDDELKMHISTSQADQGFQFVNAFGWPVTTPALMPLMPDISGARFPDYWINIWVKDIGGFGPDLLGKFQLTGDPGCTFDNAGTTLLTNTQHWKVTAGLPYSPTPAPPIGYPWMANFVPPWVQPTLVPINLGTNGSAPSPWGMVFTQIPNNAKWLSAPGQPNFTEAWFQAHIKC